uniref:Uncharacterized protein n=1 Tax=Setaria digitata TaxID=48799 RepID=A0A915PLU3_9BILA
MGLQWFSLLICFLCAWLFACGGDSLDGINGIKFPNAVIKKNREAQSVVVTWAENMSVVANITRTVPLQVKHNATLPQLERATQVFAQTSTRKVFIPTVRKLKQKQESLTIPISEFSAPSSSLQAFGPVGDFEQAEDTHFLYYMVIFGAIIICLYVASHNKKKILGFIIEGRKPPNSARRTALRYKRLRQHDDSGSDPTNVIYEY